MNETYLSSRQLVERWRGTPFEVELKTLANWRMPDVGRGPRSRKIAGRVRYPLTAIEQFEETGVHWAQRDGALTSPPAESAVDCDGPRPISAIRMSGSARIQQLEAEMRKSRRLGLHYRHAIERLKGRELLQAAGPVQ